MRVNQVLINDLEFNIVDYDRSMTPYWVQEELKGGGYALDTMNLGPEDTVIDIGSNTGIFAIYVNKKFGSKVIGFEPVKSIYENAIINLTLNRVDDVIIHNSAITSKDGDTIQICLDERNSGGSSAFKNDGHIFDCKTESLHKYLESESNLKLLKIDCEGGEYELIPSILEHLNKFEFIAIEYHKYKPEQDPIALHNLIIENYKGKLISNNPAQPIYW
jgi:FkbM family methyltransferase